MKQSVSVCLLLGTNAEDRNALPLITQDYKWYDFLQKESAQEDRLQRDDQALTNYNYNYYTLAFFSSPFLINVYRVP